MASEKEKMIAERLYHSFGPELTSERTAARRLCEEFNRTTGNLLHARKLCSAHTSVKDVIDTPATSHKSHGCAGDEPEKRIEILNKLFHGGMDMSKPTFIEPPFTVDYVRLSL